MKRKRKTRYCSSPAYSICSTGEWLEDLDFKNWWQDNGYIHVQHKDGETWHRVYPRQRKGYESTRIGVEYGSPYWIYDKTEQP